MNDKIEDRINRDEIYASKKITQESVIHMVEGINFPINKDEFIKQIEERKGKVSNIKAVLGLVNQIPNRQYFSLKHLEMEIEKVNQ